MKQWTFGKQIGMGMVLLFASGILAAVLHNSVFLNLAWILYSLRPAVCDSSRLPGTGKVPLQ